MFLPGLGLDHFEEVEGETADEDGEDACFLGGSVAREVDLGLGLDADLDGDRGFDLGPPGDAGGDDDGLDYFVERVLFQGEAEEAPGGVELVTGSHGDAITLVMKDFITFQTHHLIPRPYTLPTHTLNQRTRSFHSSSTNSTKPCWGPTQHGQRLQVGR